MSSVKDGFAKSAERNALQKEIAFYSNLLTQHQKLLMTSKQYTASKQGPVINSLHSSTVTDAKFSRFAKCNQSNHQNVKFLSNSSPNKILPKSSILPSSHFCNKAVFKNKYKVPVIKGSVSLVNKCQIKPAAKNISTIRNTSNYQKGASVYKKSITNLGEVTSNPFKLHRQRTVKYNGNNSFVFAGAKNSKSIARDVTDMQTIKETYCQDNISNPHSLIGEIFAITQKLKQTSHSLSTSSVPSSKTLHPPSISSRKTISIDGTMCNQDLKSSANSVHLSDATKKKVQDIPKVLNYAVKSHLSVTFPVVSATKLANRKNLQQPVMLNASILKHINSPLLPVGSTNAVQQKKVPDSNILLLTKKKLENFETCNKPVKRYKSVQIVSTPVRRVGKIPSISANKKSSNTEQITSKYKVINKKSLFNSTYYSNASKDQDKIPKWASNKKLVRKDLVSKPEQLISKYKMVNKKLDLNNSARNNGSSEFSLIKNSVGNKYILLKKRKINFEGLSENKLSKTVDRTVLISAGSNPNVAFLKPVTKLYTKTNKNVGSFNRNMKSPISLKKQRIHSLSQRSAPKSRYKVIKKPSPSVILSTPNKLPRILKLSTNKLCNFKSDIDMDLLMELAAEKSSKHIVTKTPVQEKHVLMKRVYKSKNAIVNKNVHSVQVKRAKMIKSKYFATNKKYPWQRQAVSSKFAKHKHFQGRLYNSFQAKKHVVPYHCQRIKRNQSKFINYSNTANSLKRNSKRLYHPHIKQIPDSTKVFRRLSTNRIALMKVLPNTPKQSTPVTKMLASRVLQHSINRVLTASLKKKTSKANIYCMFYNRFGRCNKGTKCPYIHDPSKIAICTRFLRGTCKVDNCPFSHEISPGKMAICSFFLSGSCKKTDCPYRHEMLSPGSDLCKAFVKGYCSNGKECKKAHVLVCPQYVQGFCSKGDACAFPHPPPKEKKISSAKANEKSEHSSDTDEFLMERVSRYFQPLNEDARLAEMEPSSSSVVPKRKILPEQPSFISLSFTDNKS